MKNYYIHKYFRGDEPLIITEEKINSSRFRAFRAEFDYLCTANSYEEALQIYLEETNKGE